MHRAAALPALQRVQGQGNRLSFFIPVIAAYDQLEPVLQRALNRRSERPFDVPGIGPVDAKFERVTGYGTTNNRLAVGLTVTATETVRSITRTQALACLVLTCTAFDGVTAVGLAEADGDVLHAPTTADELALTDPATDTP